MHAPLRLRRCDTRTYFVVDTAKAEVYADRDERGRAGRADVPDAALAALALASAREYEEYFARAVPGTRTPDGEFDVRGPVPPAEQAELAVGGDIPVERAALRLHLDFFDPDLDGRITLAENYCGWRGLGFARLAALWKTLLSALLFGRIGTAMTIDIARFDDKRYAGSTGIFDREGRLDEARLGAYLAEFDLAGGRLSFDETIALLDRNCAKGMVSRTQFRSLFNVCQRLNGNAKVITKAQFSGLFDGSLLWRAASMTDNAGRRAQWLTGLAKDRGRLRGVPALSDR